MSLSTFTATEFRDLENYALNPELRDDLVKSCTPNSKGWYLSQLRFLSQELQEATVDPSTDIKSPAIAAKFEKALKLLREYEPLALNGDRTELERLKAQFAILGYSVNPDILLKELDFNPDTIAQLNNSIVFVQTDTDNEQSDICDSLPTTLDESLFDIDSLSQQLMDKLISDYNTSVPNSAWPHLLAQPQMRDILLKAMSPTELLTQLERMSLEWSSKSLEMLKGNSTSDTSDWIALDRNQEQNPVEVLIVDVILRLYQEKKLDFTGFKIQYSSLTNAQMDWIKEKEPSVMNNERFVGMLEHRIVPRVFDSSPTETGKVTDPKTTVRGEWLARMMAFVDSLPPKYNRHRLAVFLMSLEYDLANGVYDKDKFMKFIEIPRNHNYYNPSTLKKIFESSFIVDTNNTQALQYWTDRVKPATKARDEYIVKEFLYYFLQKEKSGADYEYYFDVKSFLNPILGHSMLFSGDQDILKWSSMLAPSDGGIAKLTEKTIIRFPNGNPKSFLPSDSVVFKLRVKNTKRILVRVFEIKTLEYLQQYGDSSAFGQVLNLDGLTPNWEKHLMLDHPPLEMHDLQIDLPELADRRGAFVMDVISNGENSSAYFTKGYLDFVEKQSVAGHILTIIDENKRKIDQDVGIWFNGFYYKTNKHGDIVIPYRNPKVATDKNIYITHNDFTSRRPFTHHPETYSMSLCCYIDHESLVAGSIAKILIKAVVQIDSVNVTCPVKLLDQVVLEVVSHDTSGIEGTVTIPDFKLYDNDWTEYSFQVPENLSSVEFSLSAKIKVISTGRFDDLSDSKNFTIERPSCDDVVVVHVQHRKQDVLLQGEILTVLRASTTNGTDTVYEIHVMGKNGEKRPNIPLEVSLMHPLWYTSLDVFLRSDSEGIVHLGKLQDISEIRCNRLTWDLLTKSKHSYPKTIHGVAGEPVILPFSRRDVLFIRSISLYRRSPTTFAASRCLFDDLTGNIKLGDGILTIEDLHEGYYKLNLAEEDIEIIISNAKIVSHPVIKGLEEFNIESDPMMRIPYSIKHPLYLSSVVDKPSEEKIQIQIRNWTPATRVCVVATKFLPYKPIFESLGELGSRPIWLKPQAERIPTVYRIGRVLGEEYQYILNRKAQSKHWVGNLLTKPSVLLTPLSIGATTMSQEVMANQNFNNGSCAANGFGCAPNWAGGQGLGRGGAMRHRRILPPGAHPLLTFFSNPSVLLANLIPNQRTGIVELPYSKSDETNFLQILVTDGTQTIQHSCALPSLAKKNLQKRDLRFKSSQDYTKHYISERIGVGLDPKRDSLSPDDAAESSHSITLSANGSSSSAVRVINSVSQVYDLMITLLESEAHKQTLRKFGFVVEWHKLSDPQKNEKFSKWNCHELNLFLYNKDRPFFDSVVAPFIKNKLIKSFVDDYLIGASLEKYTSLSEFSLLTCMEKCLLAHRIPRLRSSVTKWIRSRVHNTKVTSDVKLFRTVMKFGATEDEEAGDGNGRGDNPDEAVPNTSAEAGVSSEGFELVERPGSGSIFGAPSTSAFGQPSTSTSGLFGSAAPSGFGLPAAQSGFGSTAPQSGTSLFGSSVAPSGFGSSAPQSGTSLFGSSAAPSGFGSSAPQSGTSLFGSSAAPPGTFSFGSSAAPPSSQPGFGSTTNSGRFGGFGGFGVAAQSGPQLQAQTQQQQNQYPLQQQQQQRQQQAQQLMQQQLMQQQQRQQMQQQQQQLQQQQQQQQQFQQAQQARDQSELIIKQQFKPLDLTKEVTETYYWGRQDSAVEVSKKDVNAFWLDFVEWDESKGESFLSENFVANTQNFTNAMATIALLGVTFDPKDASIGRAADRSFVVSSSSPAIIFHSSIKELKEVAINGSVLVTQQYFEKLEKTEYNAKQMTNVRRYIRPGAEFMPLESYGAHVVLMNATPNPMKLHLELQLPQGAICIYNPIESGQDVQLAAHGTFQYEYHFYFPDEGDFPHYPAHISDYENIVAFANHSVLKVRKPEQGQAKDTADLTSWSHVIARGTQEEVLEKLKSDPLESIRVELLMPRLYRDKNFLKLVTDVLRSRHEYNDRIWSVSLMIKETEEKEVLNLVSEYLANKPIVQKLGYWFTSTLATRKPRNRYETAKGVFHYLEYFPLINARVHKAKNVTILNYRFKEQYIRFLTLLSQKPKHDVEDLLVLTVYLLAQDRILEAKEQFVKLSALVKEGHLDELNDSQEQRLEGEHTSFQAIQYDYLRAYLSLCVEVQDDNPDPNLVVDLDDIQAIANKYQNYPVQRWNKLFKDLKTYVDEILRTTSGRNKTSLAQSGVNAEQGSDTVIATEKARSESSTSGSSNKAASRKPIRATVDFKIGSDSEITIHHRGVEQIIVEYYAIDAETMFSASPLTFSDQGESEINVAANGAITAGAVEITNAKPAAFGGGSPVSDTTSYRLVKPNGVDKHTVEYSSDDAVLKVPILEKYLNTNVMISVLTSPPAATKTWKAFYSQSISVLCQEGRGTIKVVTKPAANSDYESQPIRGGYVKVYAEMKSNRERVEQTLFWKDGYTDLVGRFNYAIVSTSPSKYLFTGGYSPSLTDVKRFVLFVDGGKEGCVVKTVPVPPV